jgi:phosphoenolpyruvate carboxylase
LAELVNELAMLLPRRRERMLHIGLFGYPRGLRGKVLPRAITFTGTFYSLGVPPEFLGTGRALRDAEREGLTEVLMRHYRHLRDDLVRAGNYLCWENLHLLERESPVWALVREDIELCQRFLGIEFGPTDTEHYLHRNMASSIFHLWRRGGDETRLRRYIVEAAQLRRSLG